jgi:hypothetical protein
MASRLSIYFVVPSFEQVAQATLPVLVGYQPTGTSDAFVWHTGARLQINATSHSAGLVAQRDGQVARATQ